MFSINHFIIITIIAIIIYQESIDDFREWDKNNQNQDKL